MSTICAISTPHGIGGIAVIRVSGDEAISIANRIWKGKNLEQTPSHTAHLGVLVDPANGERLDEAVATVFRAPASFTGEDVVELSVHGSQWIQNELVNMLIRNGCQLAEPGEFTRRAFANGKLDLTEAEAVADVIAATSRASNRLAQQQMRGQFSAQLGTLHDSMLELASLLELELDFSEEDVEFADRGQLAEGVTAIKEEVERLADSYLRGKVYKEGISIALAGVPNAGKSSLLNRLVEEEKALVTDIAGTTRDVIEATAEIGGVLCRFYDTAGLRQTTDLVEGLGIERARERIRNAAIVLWLIDPTQNLGEQRQEYLSAIIENPEAFKVIVYTKSDLTDTIRTTPELEDPVSATEKTVYVSAKTGEGLDELKQVISDYCGIDEEGSMTEQETLVTNLRHYQELQSSLPYLRRIEEGMATLPTDLLAEELRGALTHIGAITGAITTPDLLQNIFAHFCIGK